MLSDIPDPLHLLSALALGFGCGCGFVLALALRDAVGEGILGWSSARNRALITFKWAAGLCIWYVLVSSLAARSHANGGSHVELLLATATTALSGYCLRHLSTPIGARARKFLEASFK